MKTIIKVNKNYQVIEKKIINEKSLPSKVLDMIVPVLKNNKE